VCPFCFSTIAMVAIGAVSSGGVAAIVVKKVRARHDAEILTSQCKGEENATENRLAQ
jgi:uncharacterized protein YoaH (UPF0181 family)